MIAASGSRELFRSAELLVRGVIGFGPSCCVVTFDSLVHADALEREGFGEVFLAGQRIDAVHVTSRGDRWYQYPEMMAAAAIIRAAVSSYDRVVTYGSSMGAYAALRLAGLVGADTVIALSPQFSLRPELVPFEFRWPPVPLEWEAALALPRPERAYLFYDPDDPDSLHAELFGAAMKVTLVPVRGGGHPVSGMLAELGLLQRAVVSACSATLDVESLRLEAWRRRRQSAQYLAVLAGRARPARTRLALLLRARALSPEHPLLAGMVAEAMDQAGRREEGLAEHERAVALLPGHAGLLVGYAQALRLAGEVKAEAAVLARLAAIPGWLPEPPGQPSQRQDTGPGPPPDASPVRAAPGERGMVLHGPYRVLPPGGHVVRFTLRAPGWPRLPGDLSVAARLEVAIRGGREVIAARRLRVLALRGGYRSFDLPFRLPSRAKCEFRVFTTGRVALDIQPFRPVRRDRTS